VVQPSTQTHACPGTVVQHLGGCTYQSMGCCRTLNKRSMRQVELCCTHPCQTWSRCVQHACPTGRAKRGPFKMCTLQWKAHMSGALTLLSGATKSKVNSSFGLAAGALTGAIRLVLFVTPVAWAQNTSLLAPASYPKVDQGLPRVQQRMITKTTQSHMLMYQPS
jgi:hypothetical protein